MNPARIRQIKGAAIQAGLLEDASPGSGDEASSVSRVRA
jgi:hypothetical protein